MTHWNYRKSDKFKKFDEVFLVKRGQIEWETRDWTMNGDRTRLDKNTIYIIEETSYYNGDRGQPCVRVNGYLYHEDHFKKHEIQKQ